MLDVYSYRNRFSSSFPNIKIGSCYCQNIPKLFSGSKRTKVRNVLQVQPHPWHNSPANTWDDQPPCDNTYITTYHNFLQSEYGRTNVVDYATDLEQAEQYIRTQEDSTSDDYEYQATNHVEEWMLHAMSTKLYVPADTRRWR